MTNNRDSGSIEAPAFRVFVDGDSSIVSAAQLAAICEDEIAKTGAEPDYIEVQLVEGEWEAAS